MTHDENVTNENPFLLNKQISKQSTMIHPSNKSYSYKEHSINLIERTNIVEIV